MSLLQNTPKAPQNSSYFPLHVVKILSLQSYTAIIIPSSKFQSYLYLPVAFSFSYIDPIASASGILRLSMLKILSCGRFLVLVDVQVATCTN